MIQGAKVGSVMFRTAQLSDCDRYRYSLTRQWELGEHRPVCFIMLNPSTANACVDDPTIRKCIGFAKRWGFLGMSVVNLFALRSRNPRELLTAVDPAGEDNLLALKHAMRGAALVVAAWGSFIPFERDLWFRREFPDQPLHCIRVGQKGHPCHPLYMPYTDAPITFSLNGGQQ